MFFRLFLFFAFLSAHLSASQELEHYSIDSPPLWVKPYTCILDPIPVKPSQTHLQFLHIDIQKNLEQKTAYYRYVFKPLTQTGVSNNSQINIRFTPSFEKVSFHSIQVFRNGEAFDRLQSSHHKVIQRESNLEQNLYDGSLSLLYFLDDIREDDIIEYSFSVTGENPLFESHYTDHITLQWRESVERFSYRLLAKPDRSFSIKPMNTDLQFTVTPLSSELQEWSLESAETPALEYFPDEPVWYNPQAFIKISEYRSWEELVLKLLPFYTLPEDFQESVPSSMKALVQEWQAFSQNPEECALLAVRFVQDKIRYLGIEEGLKAIVPSNPIDTFERRFGDCKDKSFLLHGLLALMDISSTPILVHSSNGRALKGFPPTPYAFNHAVLQIHIGNETYFVDPTISLQGGSLKTNFFPDYETGLAIESKATDLIALPISPLKNPTEIYSSFILTPENRLILTITNTFYDRKADKIRRWINQDGINQVEKEGLIDIQKVYKKAKIHSPMEFSDNKDTNVLTTIESYSITPQKTAGVKTVPLYSFIIKECLDNDFDPERPSPYALTYPVWIKEHLHIENGLANWAVFQDNSTQEHESLFYSQSVNAEGSTADFHLELHHLQDHVPADSLQTYSDIVSDIEENEPSLTPITINY